MDKKRNDKEEKMGNVEKKQNKVKVMKTGKFWKNQMKKRKTEKRE